MIPHRPKTMEFLNELIRSAGWEIRFNPQGFPYAALPRGFGNNEAGVKLHFIPNGGSVRVVGYIDFSEELGIKRPFIYVSIYGDVQQLAQLIQRRFLPRYKKAWNNAQPLIAKWLEENPQI